ncbi:probable phosphoglycerate mutase [Microlunatus sagamiharensis]|uniref:Probable phosphoglycerate mutase n=1 Tax=Microlunatus sagamiharensis TaxID=546874 RepID=A0A1H2M3H2_9ACTN|nr:histidine phosphatase family protein [Microlunatus sagamiharensis]SDU87790.1 probable phosphoglycerate mutase [Microlunatus sagamiharensis]
MRLLLLRHGQTTANVRGALDTAFPGHPLTDLGRAQAAAVPAALADEDVAAVYCSNLTRTRRTAEPLRAERGLSVGVRPGLAEVRAGDLEMRDDEAAVRGYVECLVAWMSGDLDRAMPGGEDGHHFWARYDGALDDIATRHPDETVAVVSHGAAIRVWTAISTRMSRDEAEAAQISNTGLAVLERRAGRWKLERWSSDPVGGAHLLDTAARDVTGDAVDDVEDETSGAPTAR